MFASRWDVSVMRTKKGEATSELISTLVVTDKKTGHRKRPSKVDIEGGRREKGTRSLVG